MTQDFHPQSWPILPLPISLLGALQATVSQDSMSSKTPEIQDTLDQEPQVRIVYPNFRQHTTSPSLSF